MCKPSQSSNESNRWCRLGRDNHLIGIGSGDINNTRTAKQRIGHEVAPVLCSELSTQREMNRLH